MKILATTAATLAFAFVAATGPASAKTEEVSVTVPFADLDLTSEADLERLERRLTGAINLACGRPDMKVRAEVRAVRQCREELGANARIAMDSIADNPQRYANAQSITVRS